MRTSRYLVRHFFSVLSICVFILMSTSCGSHLDLPSSKVIAQVVKLVPLRSKDHPGKIPEFKMSDVEFKSIHDLKTLDGPYFALTTHGQHFNKTLPGIGVEVSDFLRGRVADLRYRLEEGVAVPSDIDSLTMLSVYYQFDYIADLLKTLTGISIEEVVSRHGKIDVLYHPEFVQNDSSKSSKRNAAFYPTFYQFLIMAPSEIERVPVGVNLQVLAHEFGHLVFDHVLASPDKVQGYNIDLFQLEYPIMGLNEGFADFFSYVVTGSTNVLGASLKDFPNEVKERNFSSTTFKYDNYPHSCKGTFYCIGTVFAKALFRAERSVNVGERTLEKRAQFLTQIVQSMRGAKEKLNKESLVQTSRARTVIKTSDEVRSSDVLGVFFRALVSSISDPEIKRHLARTLQEEFGFSGFPAEYRSF